MWIWYETELWVLDPKYPPLRTWTVIFNISRNVSLTRTWMIRHKLKINDDKTEVILIGTKAQFKKVKIDNLAVGDYKIVPSTEAIRNLGCSFDNNFTNLNDGSNLLTTATTGNMFVQKFGND